MKRTMVVWMGLFSVLCGAGWMVWSNERILARGQVVLLELAPADPRSLMQGDYMTLNYMIGNALRHAQAREDGIAVLHLDTRRVGTLVRTQSEPNDGQSARGSLATVEIGLRYRVRHHRLMIATNAFFFQEGHAPAYRNARFGEFRVGNDGEPRLVALLDRDLKRIGENRY